MCLPPPAKVGADGPSKGSGLSVGAALKAHALASLWLLVIVEYFGCLVALLPLRLLSEGAYLYACAAFDFYAQAAVLCVPFSWCGTDVRAAYARLFGKPVREEGLEFGEKVLFRPRARADDNVLLEGRWLTGTWLGRRWGSTISRVHSQGEVVDARAMQRVPLAERWSAASLAEIRATPWCVRPPPGAAAAPAVLQP